MLKRNKVLAAFMLVAVLCMSIGFAAVSDTLTADGKLSLNVGTGSGLEAQFNDDVYFSDAGNNSTPGVTAAVDTTDNDKVNITIDNSVFTEVNKTVTVTATIKNAGEYAVTLETPTTVETNIANYVKITTASLDQTSLNAGGETTLTITLELIAIPADNVTDATFSVSVVAKPAQ